MLNTVLADVCILEWFESIWSEYELKNLDLNLFQ